VNISNTIVVNNYCGLEIQNSSNIKIYRNNISDSGTSAIFLQYSHDVSFLENYITNSWIGLKTWKSYNYGIIGNQIINNEYEGIEILGSENLTISYNIIERNEVGIRHRVSSYPDYLAPTNEVISYNQIISNTFMAFMGNFHNSSITDNCICRNNFGLQIGSNCIVTGNNISQNDGIAVRLGSNNVMTQNYISENELCFNLGGSNSRIYRNNLINNTENLIHFREMASHIWDNGEEGNYWSDYSGTDNNGDGIGDSIFIFDENNQDNYPLMKPLEIETIPEFPSWIFLPLFLVSTLTIAVYRKKVWRKIY
jgi:parallel beta-helix repeat protein